jgi:hypothetical protein
VSNEIEFPDTEPEYLFDQDCLSIRAGANGKSVECLITAELLMSRFGASEMTEEAMRQAFSVHVREIQEIARDHMSNGWIDDEHRVFLTTRFTRLRIIVSERLAKWPDGRKLVDEANRLLTEIIGPSAEEVVVEGDGQAETSGPQGVSVRISDPTIPFANKTFLDLQQLENLPFLRVYLAGVWGSVLRGRSRKMLLKMG